MKKLFVVLSMLLVVMLLVTACGPKATPAPAPPDRSPRGRGRADESPSRADQG